MDGRFGTYPTYSTRASHCRSRSYPLLRFFPPFTDAAVSSQIYHKDGGSRTKFEKMGWRLTLVLSVMAVDGDDSPLEGNSRL